MPNVSLYSSRSQEVTTEWHRQQNKEYPVGSSPLKPFLVTLTDGTCKLLLPLMCVKYNSNVNTALLKNEPTFTSGLQASAMNEAQNNDLWRTMALVLL